MNKNLHKNIHNENWHLLSTIFVHIKQKQSSQQIHSDSPYPKTFCSARSTAKPEVICIFFITKTASLCYILQGTAMNRQAYSHLVSQLYSINPWKKILKTHKTRLFYQRNMSLATEDNFPHALGTQQNLWIPNSVVGKTGDKWKIIIP
jgi:hypothetical protein